MKRFAIPTLIFAVSLLATGCGGPPPEPEVVEVPGYQALQEQFADRDMSALRGRRIVLDPGHGGFFEGAVGPGGLTEAEVNLGVALYLRGLLEWTGAEVTMTRTADYDFLTPADSSLVSDLAFRVSFTDSLQPDVFLSLHHNSVASLDRTINETQTYYPLGDDGASLDLARAIHRHLVLNLEITPARILPGNFHVLRGSTVPAVLGEPAMISHPVIEGRLSLAASQRLEAEAYFLGLLDYFSQGSPSWAGAAIDTLFMKADLDTFAVSWEFIHDSHRQAGEPVPGPGPDPGTFELALDGGPVPFHVTGGGRFVHWYPARTDLELPAVLELRGRNLKGRATPVRRTVLMSSNFRRVVFHLLPEADDGATGDRFMAARWTVNDGAPLPPGSFMIPDKESWHIVSGTSQAGLLPIADQVPEQVTFQPDDPDLPVFACDLRTSQLPAPWRWHLMESFDGIHAGPWSLRMGDLQGVPTGLADQEIRLIPHEPGRPVFVTSAGLLPLVDPDPANPDTARTIAAGDRTWMTEPLVPGLRGKVIVLDPAGGGSDADGTGPLGTRGSTLNLESALLAKGLLEGCGAVVHLTRQGESAPPPEEKVRLAGEVDADLFLTLGRSAQSSLWTASHHPGSETGERWANLFLQSAAGLIAPGDSVAAGPSYDYLLRHTACPALEVRLPGPETPADEMRLSHRGWLRTEARVVLLSIASMFENGDPLVTTLDVAAVIAALPGAPGPENVTWAELDGNFIWSPLPDQTGGAVADSLDSLIDPGLPALLERHTLEIHAGPDRQLWLLERTGPGYSGRLMMRNP